MSSDVDATPDGDAAVATSTSTVDGGPVANTVDAGLDDSNDSSDEDFEIDPNYSAESTDSAGDRPDDSSDSDGDDDVNHPDLISHPESQTQTQDVLADRGSNTVSAVQTRSQRRRAAAEGLSDARPGPVRTARSGVDVSAIWDRIRSSTVADEERCRTDGTTAPITDITDSSNPSGTSRYEDEFITIRRTYNFAGETKTEEKRVLKQSAEARVYLASLEESSQSIRPGGLSVDVSKTNPPSQSISGSTSTEKTKQPTRSRPLKRPSQFDPNPVGIVRTLPPEQQLRWPREPSFTTILKQYQDQITTRPRRGRGGGMTVLSSRGGAVAALAAARAGGIGRNRLGAVAPTKLNMVDKSRFDWAGYVDQAGIGEELDQYGKAKESYLGRSNFLAESEHRQEAARRQVMDNAGQR